MMGKGLEAHDASAPRLDMALDAAPPKEQGVRSSSMMSTSELMRYRAGPNLIEYKIEMHRRFALPVACLMLAMVGIPLGIATRKGGKSAGYVNAVFLAFFCYYLSSITLIGFARQQKLPVSLAIWLPDAAFGLAGLFLIYRMERPGDRDLLAGARNWISGHIEALKSRAGKHGGAPRFSDWRTLLLPQVVDTYILSQFVFYFALLLTSFVSLTLIYNFFELMNEMVKNHIPLMKMFKYLFFLTPELIYRTLPVSVLVAVLVTFGILSKQNEVIAFRACGVSLYRLALPILACGTVLSAGLFAFDFYYVPGANREQEALRNEIKGRPTQTYVNPDRKWIMGSKGSIIYYYRYFDGPAEMMAGVSVFELDPKSFHLVRQISAETGHWNRPQKTWVFENGWYSDFEPSGRTVSRYTATTFPELSDPPDYFLKEQVPEQQMNFIELNHYIGDLQRSGFDTVRLQVQFFRKFSVPLFALIMALLAVPFSFMVGNRGAMTGIGLSIVIAISYWGVSTLFEKVGDYSQLPAAMAAWSPDVVFTLAGLYMLLRLRS
ncbi:MAG: LptF/LptG family permease [Acidobacteriia bacterium]|nr:LptF/LptG family permease [Terriglobia bacterium]